MSLSSSWRGRRIVKMAWLVSALNLNALGGERMGSYICRLRLFFLSESLKTHQSKVRFTRPSLPNSDPGRVSWYADWSVVFNRSLEVVWYACWGCLAFMSSSWDRHFLGLTRPFPHQAFICFAELGLLSGTIFCRRGQVIFEAAAHLSFSSCPGPTIKSPCTTLWLGGKPDKYEYKY